MTVFLNNFFQRYQYITLFSIYFILNIGILDNQPFSDDFGHLFNHSYLNSVSNPLDFLNPYSSYFKSWGFSYIYFWVLFKIFGSNFTYYRLFNLILHFVNYTIFKNVLNKQQINKRTVFLISLIFLFHPLSILTTSWIFQAKTLLSTLFVLLIFNHISKKENATNQDVIYCTLLFLLSLLSKICFILLPIYFLVKSIYSDSKFFYRKLTFCTLILSFIYGLINIKGITYIVKENQELDAPIGTINVEHSIKRSEYIDHENRYKKNKGKEIKVLSEIEDSIPKYFSTWQQLDSIYDRYILSIQNIGRFFLSSIGIWDYQPFYENNNQTITSHLFIVFTLFGSFFICSILIFKNSYLTICLLSLIPVIGIFYVPYMKYSYSSDHWFYPSLFLFLLSLSKSKIKYLFESFLAIVFIQYLLNVYSYANFNNLLNKSFANNKNVALIQEIKTFKSPEGQNISRLLVYDYLLSSIFFNSQEIYELLFYESSRTNHFELLQKHFPRFFYNEAKNLNAESLNQFLTAHELDSNRKLLNALKGLTATDRHFINDDEYIRILNYLNRQ